MPPGDGEQKNELASDPPRVPSDPPRVPSDPPRVQRGGVTQRSRGAKSHDPER